MKALDAEAFPEYVLTLRASDGNLSNLAVKRTEAQLKVMVLDVNEFKPKFEQSNYQVKVPESMKVNDIVLQVKATDEDQSSHLTYKLNDTVDVFSIDANTGVIKLRQELDYGHTELYELEIEVSDGSFIVDVVVKIDVVQTRSLLKYIILCIILFVMLICILSYMKLQRGSDKFEPEEQRAESRASTKFTVLPGIQEENKEGSTQLASATNNTGGRVTVSNPIELDFTNNSRRLSVASQDSRVRACDSSDESSDDGRAIYV